MLKSPFESEENPQVHIPDETDVIVVADMFLEDYGGGAEMTLQALIDAAPLSCFKVHSKDVTVELLEEGKDQHWIFGNF